MRMAASFSDSQEFSGGGVAMAEVDRDGGLRTLRQALARLAAGGCDAPDELAIDFDNARRAVIRQCPLELPTDLVSALAAVDAAFDPIVGDGWSAAAVRSAPEWAVVRQRAAVALALLDPFAW